MNKRLVVLWDYYQPYHLARLRALKSRAALCGWDVVGLAAGPGGAARDSHVIANDDSGAASEFVALSQHNDLYSRAVAHRLVDTLDQLQPAAVIVPGYGARTARAALRWCRRHRRGAVMIFETQEKDIRRFWLKEWLKASLVRAADCAFCGGQSHARYAIKLGMPAERVFYNYSVVDNDYWWTAAESARSFPSAIPSPYFLAVGRFVPKKNFAGLVAAFAGFKRNDQAGWRLVLVGDGPEKSAIAAEIMRGQLQDNVHLAGYANATDTARWMAHAKAFVMPSHREEQWGLVVNEAMAAGLPVAVSSACGCVEDLVQDGITGLVFDAGDRQRLTEVIATLAADEALRFRLARGARERISHFSLARFAGQAIAAADCAMDVAARRP